MAVFGEVQPHVVRPEVVTKRFSLDHEYIGKHRLAVEINGHYSNIVFINHVLKTEILTTNCWKNWECEFAAEKNCYQSTIISKYHALILALGFLSVGKPC